MSLRYKHDQDLMYIWSNNGVDELMKAFGMEHHQIAGGKLSEWRRILRAMRMPSEDELGERGDEEDSVMSPESSVRDSKEGEVDVNQRWLRYSHEVNRYFKICPD